ncbi:hypothetical protein [Pseudoxanthomonas sp. SGT-18]|uniref:hypothetical protein n=1 Tax=Pseudoxanthomonas sp. SGT-18 TaxID=2493087 RepID=UPI001F10FBE1|nr:hypothetical protein [Pseudoxanthomonas sp. SGT-18]
MRIRGRYVAGLFLSVLAAGCAPAEQATAEVAPAAVGETAPAEAASEATEAPAAAEAAQPAAMATAKTRACMIAGEFEIMGQRIRSRDCLQAGADVPEDMHRQMCESLAQGSAQIGTGKAGEVAYMDACPSPNQGSCKGMFGQSSIHAFYYERSSEDLATLPASCQMAGGTWEG